MGKRILQKITVTVSDTVEAVGKICHLPQIFRRKIKFSRPHPQAAKFQFAGTRERGYDRTTFFVHPCI